MVFTAADIAGIAAAVALALPVFILPGLAVARLTGALDFDRATPVEKFGIGLLTAHAVVPLLASLGLRWLDASVLAALMVFLALAGLARDPGLVRAVLTPKYLGLASAVTAVLVVLNADAEWAGHLYQSLLMTDMFKHALFVRVLAEHGAPPVDPFFLRETPASYYYFYYAPAALVFKAGLGFIDQRAAFVGVQVWTAIATVVLVLKVLDRTGLTPRNRTGLVPATLILMSTAGLQLLLVLMTWLKGGMWREQSGWLNDMVNSFLVSAIWVPHHVSAFIAAWVAFMLLAAIAGDGSSQRRSSRLAAIALAGAALASMAGQSVWVSFGAVATVGLWTMTLLWERRKAAVLAVCTAGLLSLVLAAPHLVDLVTYRDVTDAAIAVKVRYFSLAESLAALLGGGGTVARLALLPLNYAFEATLFVIGSVIFWQRRSRSAVHANELARLLTISCAASLVIGSFLASTIGNNDLGWRVVLFAQLAGLIWTINVFAPVWQRAHRSASTVGSLKIVPRAVMPLLAFGLLAGVHDVVMLRAHHAVNRSHVEAHPVDTAVAHDLRRTYAWLSRNIAPDAIVQHNPSVIRAVGFGLYGRQRVAVSDLHSAALFGADPVEASRRLAAFGSIYDGRASAEAVRIALSAEKVTALIVTSADPVWSSGGGWAATARPIYDSPHVKVFLSSDIRTDARRVSGAGPDRDHLAN